LNITNKPRPPHTRDPAYGWMLWMENSRRTT
jgi:hypothetical protein